MNAALNAAGTRLAYVIVKIEEKLMRPQYVFERRKAGKNKDGSQAFTNEMKQVEVEEPGGYMVYFPRGHVTRMRTREDLEHYGLKVGQAPMINMSGLADPNSALGKMLQAQDAQGRADAWTALEQQVIRLAIAKTGPIIMPEQIAKRPEAPVAA